MPAKTIFISVAEHSADLHAARLVEAVGARLPETNFYGLAGPRMKAAGVEALADLTDRAAMLTGVVRMIGPAWQALRFCRRAWRERRPDLAIFLDSGALHLPMAARARRMGIPTLYYIAPQTWASRSYRNRRLARDLDRVACILPFEEAYLRAHGVRAEFVGHPLIEALAGLPAPLSDPFSDLPGDGPAIAILPGTRRQVIDRMLPLHLETAARLHRELGFSPPRVVVSAADASRAEQIHARLREGVFSDSGARVVVDENAALLSRADLALVTSGTATLEAAYYTTPMLVLYDAGRLLRRPYEWFGRWVIHAPHLSLVNILAGRRIVPEFMPFVTDCRVVARTAAALLRDAVWRERMRADLKETVRPLTASRASERMGEIIEEMLETSAGRAAESLSPSSQP